MDGNMNIEIRRKNTSTMLFAGEYASIVHAIEQAVASHAELGLGEKST